MFTGLVEEVGRVERVEARVGGCRLWIAARRVLEDMRNRAYDLDTDELVNGTTFPASTGYGGISGYPTYRRTIAFTNNSPEAGTKTVTVVVFYRNSSGVEQPVTLSTIFTQAN